MFELKCLNNESPDQSPKPTRKTPFLQSIVDICVLLLFSKLLQQLDKAAQEDPVGIEEAVLDKG